MEKNEMKFMKFLRLAFSESGSPSSKRIVGGLTMIVVLFCTVWCCVHYGMCEYLKNVIETEIICSCALLGVSSVTRIWSQKTNNTFNNYDVNSCEDKNEQEIEREQE